MSLVKKLIFALPFLLTLAYFFYLSNKILDPTNLLFSLSWETFWQIILITAVLLLTGFFFVLFGTFSQDWKIILGVAVVAALLAIPFFPTDVSLVVVGGTMLVLIFVFAMLSNKLKTYLTFQPVILLPSSMRSTATLLIIVISIASFLTLETSIKAKGVQIPDSMLTLISQMTLSSTSNLDFETPMLTPEACKILQTNPQLLIKSVPKDQLELIDPTNCKLSKPKIEEKLKQQATQLITPYAGFIPFLLAFSLFLALTSIAALVALLLPFLIWATFYILKASHFTKFTTEMREVKKLVV